MNVALWIAQVLLALAFALAGFMKVSQPIDKLAVMMTWVKDYQPSTVRLIGAVEILGAIGLIVPAVTGILPWLTPLAAAGLVLTMIGAIMVHARRNEVGPRLSMNVVLLLLAAFVVFGRFVSVPL